MKSNQFISLLKLNQLYKKKFFKTRLFKRDLKIINLLMKLNIIKYMIFDEKNNESIIFINNKSKIRLVHMSRKKNRLIKLFELKKLFFKKKWVAILSTSYGLLTSKECVEKKIGGVLLYNIILN